MASQSTPRHNEVIDDVVSKHVDMLLADAQHRPKRSLGLLTDAAFPSLKSGKSEHPLDDGWLAAVPEALFSWLWPVSRGSTESVVETSVADGEPPLRRRTSNALLAHTLSPAGDSIAIIADLGRFMRVSRIIGLKADLMLAGETWAKLNWVVRDLKLEKLLNNSFTMRAALYELAGIEAHECTAESGRATLGIRKLSGLANDLSRLVEEMFGPEFVKQRLNREMIKAVGAGIPTRESLRGLLDIELLRKTLEAVLDVIAKVAEELRRLDTNTFHYFLLQWYHQRSFKDHLKVTIRRERSFDEPFRLMERDAFWKTTIGFGDPVEPLVGLYHDDYYFTRTEQGIPLTIQPYYFPSGALYRYLVEQVAGEDRDTFTDAERHEILALAQTHVPMFGDRDRPFEARAAQVERSLRAMYPFDRGRFLSDMLSFPVFAKAELSKRIAGRLIGLAEEFGAPRWIGAETSASIRAYTEMNDVGSHSRIWVRQCLDARLRSAISPPVTLPFVWELLPARGESEDPLIKFGAALVVVICEEIEKVSSRFTLPNLALI